MSSSKFKIGDRIIQDINGMMITATFTGYDEHGQFWCLWDDDGERARTDEDTVELLEIYYSPLFKALR